jgi:DedD protein
MDRRLKERLIGAAVLVAFGVWIIPWVLDGRQEPEPPPAATLELPAPNDVSPIRTETLRLDEDPTSSALTSPESIDAPRVPAARVAGERPEMQAAVPEPASAPPAPATRPAAAATPDVAAAEPEPEPEPEPERETEAEPPAALRAAAASGPGWIVQLGSFGDEENARRLAERVETYGYAAQESPFRSGGRVMHRVRLAPEPSRAEAEALAASLGAHGFVAQVLASD